jgi:Flp pilus assembly protein TadD
MKAGDTPAALAEYRTLCVLQPQNAKRFADTAFAYHKQGDAEQARQYAQQAVKLDPGSPAKALVSP